MTRYKEINLLDIMTIAWECETCQVEFETDAPIYDEINGQVVYFSCDYCGHDYRVELDEREQN
jgi:hypothetical protein